MEKLNYAQEISQEIIACQQRRTFDASNLIKPNRGMKMLQRIQSKNEDGKRKKDDDHEENKIEQIDSCVVN